MSLATDLYRLQALLNSKREVTVALGWSDAGNEVLTLYDVETDLAGAQIEALGGLISVSVDATLCDPPRVPNSQSEPSA